MYDLSFRDFLSLYSNVNRKIEQLTIDIRHLNKSKYTYFNINSEVISPELNICLHSYKWQSNNHHNCFILKNINYINYLSLILDNKLK